MPNVHFIVVEATTGKIIRSGNVPKKLVCLQAREDEKCIEVNRRVDDNLEYYDFKEKKLKEIPGRKEELARKAAKRTAAQTQLKANMDKALEVLQKIQDGKSRETQDKRIQQIAAVILQNFDFFEE